MWDVIIQKSNSETPLVRHYIREIEKWILRLLSAPVPVPGKTRVEVNFLFKFTRYMNYISSNKCFVLLKEKKKNCFTILFNDGV